MPNFPGGLDAFATKTDGIDKYLAADMNAVQSGVAALEQGGVSQQTVAEAVLVSGVDATLGQTVFVTLTANRVVGAPLNPAAGRRLHFIFTENGTGGWTLTFNAVFSITNWALNTAANARTEMTVEYDATAGKWVVASNPVSSLPAAVALPSGGTTLSGGPLGGVKFQDKGGQVFNALSYAADPTGAANSLTAANNLDSDVTAVGGTGFWPPGTYRIIGPNGWIWSNGPAVHQGAGEYATTLLMDITSGANAPIIQINSGTGARHRALRDMTLDWQKGVGGDTRTGFNAAVSLFAASDWEFTRVRFIRGPGIYAGLDNTFGGLFDTCLFQDFGVPTNTAIQGASACRKAKIRNCRGHYLKAFVVTGGGASSGVDPAEEFDISDCDLDGGWYTSVQVSSGSGAGVTYTATVLTDTGAAFAGLLTNDHQWLRIMNVLASGSGGTVSYDTVSLTDSAAPFNASWAYYIVRAGGKFMPGRTASTTTLRGEEWLDDTTRDFTTPPPAGTAYTVYQVYLGSITAFTGTTVTVGDFFDLNGNAVTPAAGTRYELLPPVGSYAVYFSGYTRRSRAAGLRIKRFYGDAIEHSIYSEEIETTDCMVEDGRDTGIYFQGLNHISKGCIARHMGKIGFGNGASDVQQVANRAWDSGWCSRLGTVAADFYSWGATRPTHIGCKSERRTLTAAAYKDGFLQDGVTVGAIYEACGSRNHPTADWRIIGTTVTQTQMGKNNTGVFDSTWPVTQAPAALIGQVGAVASVAALTTFNDGAKHRVEVSATITITTHGTESINVQVTYTDDNGTVQTDNLPLSSAAGTMAAAANALGQWRGRMPIDCNPNTPVTLKTAGTFTGGVVYNVSGKLEP